MLRLSLLLVVLSHPSRNAYVTNTPSFAARLDRFYEKLERVTIAPPRETTTESKTSQWNLKLQKLNSLSPDNFYLSDEDEDLLMAMQSWDRFSPDQLDGVAKDLQRIRDEKEEDRSERLTEQYYADLDENDEEYSDPDYHNDGKDDEDDEELETSSAPPRYNVTPSAFTREEPLYVETTVSAVLPLAATNKRPQILSNDSLTALDRSALRQALIANIGRVVRAGKCLVPQPRWLTVRQLAPAADIVYMPPCVELHRCAPDSGCCDSEAEVCAPIEGENVTIPFYLRKADGSMTIARMRFFNHTQCACVSRDTLQKTIRSRLRPVRRPLKEEDRLERRPMQEEERPERRPLKEEEHLERRPLKEEERQNDWRQPTEFPRTEKEEYVTAPPQMRRCTCPAQFLANMSETGPCTCVCEWENVVRRRNCLPLARGDEHFGMRDRVCVLSGDCSPPSCKYGAYDRNLGKCPGRKFRRLRFHSKRYHPEKTVVV